MRAGPGLPIAGRAGMASAMSGIPCIHQTPSPSVPRAGACPRPTRRDFQRRAATWSGTHSAFPAVEINSSFYRPHRVTTYAKWAAAVPDGFRFAVKVPRSVTHERRLIGADEPLARFLGEVAGLGTRLGPLLLQLPPSLAFDSPSAASFLTEFRRRFPGDIVCEPRHATWFTQDVDRLLVGLAIARVAADPAPVRNAAVPAAGRTSSTTGSTARRGCTTRRTNRASCPGSPSASKSTRPSAVARGASSTTPRRSRRSVTPSTCSRASGPAGIRFTKDRALISRGWRGLSRAGTDLRAGTGGADNRLCRAPAPGQSPQRAGPRRSERSR